MAEANWYVVHTYSGYENKVKANIEKTIENRHLEEEILEVRTINQHSVNAAFNPYQFENWLLPLLIMTVMAGSSIDLNYAQENCNGILLAWYPGARGGEAFIPCLSSSAFR